MGQKLIDYINQLLGYCTNSHTPSPFTSDLICPDSKLGIETDSHLGGLNKAPAQKRVTGLAQVSVVRKTTPLLHRRHQTTVGGGSLPGETLPTIVISVESAQTGAHMGVSSVGMYADQKARLFREQSPPIIGRIEEDKFVLDLRTVFPHQDETLVSAIKNIFVKKS